MSFLCAYDLCVEPHFSFIKIKNLISTLYPYFTDLHNDVSILSVAYSIRHNSQIKRMYSNTSSPRFIQFQSQKQSVFLQLSFLVENVCLQKTQPPYQKPQLHHTKAVQPFLTIHQPNPKSHQDKNKGYIFFNVRHQPRQKGHQPCQNGYQPSQIPQLSYRSKTEINNFLITLITHHL